MQSFANPAKNITHLALAPGMKVADLGAGSGFYSMLAAPLVGERGKVYAVDVVEDLLSRIKKEAQERNYKNIEVLHRDVEERRGTGLADDSCDAVIISNVLFQIENKEGFVLEVHRILKPGKKALVIGWEDAHRGLGPALKEVVTRKEAHSLFKEAGFEIMRDIEVGGHHWGFIAQKNS